MNSLKYSAILLGGVMAFASAAAQAKVLSVTVNSQGMLHAKLVVPKSNTGNQTPPAQPLRQAKVTVKVVKYTYQPGDSGSYSFVQSDVCTVTGMAPVYDLRGQTDANLPDSGPSTQCASTVAGTPVWVQVYGFVFYAGPASMAFAMGDVKAFASIMAVNPQGNQGSSNEALFNFSEAFSSDLHTPQLGFALQPFSGQEVNCVNDGQTCTATNPEYFTSIISIEDNVGDSGQ